MKRGFTTAPNRRRCRRVIAAPALMSMSVHSPNRRVTLATVSVLAEPMKIGSTANSIARLAVRVTVGGAIMVASAVILSSGTSEWTTVGNVTESGSDWHGNATTSAGVVLVVACWFMIVGRLNAVACATGVVASLCAFLAAWSTLGDARQVPAEAGDASIRVVIHPALWHTLWAAAGALVAALLLSTIELLSRRRRRIQSF